MERENVVSIGKILKEMFNPKTTPRRLHELSKELNHFTSIKQYDVNISTPVFTTYSGVEYGSVSVVTNLGEVKKQTDKKKTPKKKETEQKVKTNTKAKVQTDAQLNGFRDNPAGFKFKRKGKKLKVLGFKKRRILCKDVDTAKKYLVPVPVVKKIFHSARASKLSAPSKKASQVTRELNDKLKQDGLWRKGAQFLSSTQKKTLLKARSEEARQEVYTILDEKLEAMNA